MQAAKSYITHIGTAVPPFCLPQQDILNIILENCDLSISKTEKLKKIYAGTQINQRHSILDFEQYSEIFFSKNHSIATRMQWFEQHASDLGITAIKNSGIEPATLSAVTHLITVSCTGMHAPGIDIEIIKKCQLSPQVARTCIYFMGCSAMFNALKTADAICLATKNARVLIVSVELCTLHFYTDDEDDQIIANALFADGAACALVQSSPVGEKNLSLENFYSHIIHNSENKMAWSIRDMGFQMKLSASIPLLIANGIKKLIAPLANAYDIHFDAMHYFAIHPGGPKILDTLAEVLSIEPAQMAHSYEVLKNYGNMSSATILFILQQLLNTIQKTDHDKTILSMAFAPGLIVESALLKVIYD